EREVEGGGDRGNAADPAMRHPDRIAIAAVLRLRLLEALGIALAVAELERIGDRLRQLDAAVGTLVEQHGEAALGRQAHMVAAGMADEEVGLELAMEQHLAA